MYCKHKKDVSIESAGIVSIREAFQSSIIAGARYSGDRTACRLSARNKLHNDRSRRFGAEWYIIICPQCMPVVRPIAANRWRLRTGVRVSVCARPSGGPGR